MYSSVGGVTVSMVAFQAVDPGSTPGRRTRFLKFIAFESYELRYIQISTIFESSTLRVVYTLILVFKTITTPVGLEPTASGLEVRRAIHCATGSLEMYVCFKG